MKRGALRGQLSTVVTKSTLIERNCIEASIETMMKASIVVVSTMILVLLIGTVTAFAPSSSTRLSSTRSRPKARHSALWMTKKEDEEIKNDTVANNSNPSSSNAGVDQPIGMAKGILLGVPLFMKLCVVLIIKFIMDVCVFPVLFLYKGLKYVQRKVVKMFQDEPSVVNGESPP